MKSCVTDDVLLAAVLLSGMKAQGLPYSPYSVKRAVEMTAQHLDSIDEFAQGHGLLQVERAFEHLVSYHEEVERDVRFHVTCGISSKGVHLRGGLQEHPKEVNINIEPIFLNADDTGES
jgi:tripeptidyl-peptidase-2